MTQCLHVLYIVNEHFTLLNFKFSKQKNSHDCGAFVCFVSRSIQNITVPLAQHVV